MMFKSTVVLALATSVSAFAPSPGTLLLKWTLLKSLDVLLQTNAAEIEGEPHVFWRKIYYFLATRTE
jgi:hypothetical protein